MKSIFRYPGGKTRPSVREWILAHRPAVVREYREPFVGGGGVFFALPDVLPDLPGRWINDIHPGLVAVYEALRDRPDEFLARCRDVPAARSGEPTSPAGAGAGRAGKPVNRRLAEVFDRVRLDETCDQAFRFFFVNRTVFAGRVNYDRPSRLYFSKPEGWDIIEGERLERAAAFVRRVPTRITCGDYEALFSEAGQDVWVYADPPYVVNDEAHGNSKLYQHCFSRDDHRRLADVVTRCPHRVALSYNDDPDGFARSLYRGERFRVMENHWAYNGSTLAQKERGRELLILNYEVPRRELFDMTPGPAVPADGSLADYEAVIDRSSRAFAVMGRALEAIRGRRLFYPAYDSFDDYCRGRWGLEMTHVYQLIAAARVMNLLQLSAAADKSKPISEFAIRPLTRLKDEDGDLDVDRISAAWKQVEARVADGECLTADLVRDVVRTETGEPERAAPADLAEEFLRWFDGLDGLEQDDLIARMEARRVQSRNRFLSLNGSVAHG